MRADRLDSWSLTWNQVLDGRDGGRIKTILDNALPKSQLIVAHKD
jgi:hypothetical protein